jgi:ankyrin repeat protein
LADSINDQDYKGNTALHYAQMYGYTQLAEYMVSKLGADETLVNRDGASAWINVEEATEVAD